MELSEIKNMAETILRKGCPDMTDYEVQIENRSKDHPLGPSIYILLSAYQGRVRHCKAVVIPEKELELFVVDDTESFIKTYVEAAVFNLYEWINQK